MCIRDRRKTEELTEVFGDLEKTFEEIFDEVDKDDMETDKLEIEGDRKRGDNPQRRGGGDEDEEQGPAKKSRQFTWEDLAKKIKTGVCAGAAQEAEEMKIDEDEAAMKNGVSIEKKKNWADIEDESESGDWINEMWGPDWEQTLKEHDLEDECEENAGYAWDDLNGVELPMKNVVEARTEEMQHMINEKKFEIRTEEECWRVTGKGPISTKWVDTDKSHGQGKLDVRSRWVARDFKAKGEKDREDLFSATPPLELFRYALSRQATRSPSGKERKSMYLDVKKAHLIPRCEQDVYVQLPAEAGARKGECAKLNFWLYGCRPAAQAWEKHYGGTLGKMDFGKSEACPVAFTHKTRDLICIVHGDDFMFVGPDEDLDFAWNILNKEYQIKNRGRLGSGRKDVQEIDMLGRTIRYHDWGLTWQGDERHRKMLLEYFGLNGESKALTKNGYKEDETEGGMAEELGQAEASPYRMLAARLNYLSQDDPALQFSAKEACRRMAKPRERDFNKVKRLCRFMLGATPAVWKYPWQESEAALNVYTDSDWAGCVRSRRSTSGGLVMLGKHPLKAWSSTQSVVAMSSAEAELYSACDGACRGLGLQTMLGELGANAELSLFLDSSAAKAFASTRGIGRMRHLSVKTLWLQSAVHRGRLKLFKVWGEINPADVLTKYQDRAGIQRLLALAGICVDPVVRDDQVEGGCW